MVWAKVPCISFLAFRFLFLSFVLEWHCNPVAHVFQFPNQTWSMTPFCECSQKMAAINLLTSAEIDNSSSKNFSFKWAAIWPECNSLGRLTFCVNNCVLHSSSNKNYIWLQLLSVILSLSAISYLAECIRHHVVYYIHIYFFSSVYDLCYASGYVFVL